MSQGSVDIEGLVDVEPEPDPEPLLEQKSPFREWIPRRPAVLLAVALMAGIGLHDHLPIDPRLWLIGTAAMVVLAIVIRRRGWPAMLALLLGMTAAGVAVAQLEAFYYPADHIARYTTDTPRLAQLEVHLDTPPRVLSGAFGQFKALPPKQVALATVTRVKTWSGWRDCRGQALVQIAQPHPRLAEGQTLRVLGMLQRPGPAMNPGQFDWAAYYRDQRILVSLQILQTGNIEILSEGAQSLTWRYRQRVRELLATGFPASRSLDHALLRALVLGDSDPELRDVQDAFKRTGTSHHLAISGLHIAVLSTLVFAVCRLVRLSPRKTAVIVLAFVIAYGWVALPSPPVLRSVLLCSALAVGILAGRRVDTIQLLFVAVIAMLLVEPLDLFNAGFQLSFGTVLGLLLFSDRAFRRWQQWRGEIKDPDFARRPRIVRWRRAAVKHFQLLFVAGVVAWAVSAPLIALHFGQLNPWAIAAGIVLGPFVFLALIGGFAKVLLTLALPTFADTWAALAAWPVAAMRHVVEWLAMMPGADVPLPIPPLWLVFLYYGFLLLMLIPTKRPKWRIAISHIPAAACLAVIILPILNHSAQVRFTSPLRVTILAIGAGQTAVVQTPADRVVLIDAGSMNLGDLVHKCLGPFLRQAGEREVETIFLTHGDYDHISAVADVVAAYGVHETFIGPRFRFHATGNAPAEAMLRVLDQLDKPPRILMRGDTLPLGRDVQIDVLWPQKTSALSSNDDAMVMRLSYAGRRILFPGDIQDDAMRELLKHPEDLKADVLIAAHHGSSEKLTEAFVNAVDPKYILSSNDRTLTGKQKRLTRLIGDRPLLRTNECGAIEVSIDDAGDVKISTFLGRHESTQAATRIPATNH
jgi:competence protein ComEC